MSLVRKLPNRSAAFVRAQRLGVGYTRYSTENQGSTAEQVAINEEVAAEEDVTLVRHFKDEGISRSISDRPGLRELFAYLEDHPEVGFLVVNELERMTAGVNQRQEIIRICKRLRITVVTEDMGCIDPHDEDKMHEADQRAVAAKGEVLKVRRRTRRNLRQKIRSKNVVAMRPPYGVRMKPLVMKNPDGTETELPSGMSMLDSQGRKVTSGVLEKHPEEYPWLVKIFEWASTGTSINEICRKLMAAGVPTKTGKQRWDGTTIAGILANPLYKGEYVWGRRETLRHDDGRKFYEARPDGDPGVVTLESPLGAIIDPVTWETVQKVRESRTGTRMMERRAQDPQVLDHYVFCGRCGHKMYGRADPNQNGFTWRYVCLSSYGSTSFRPVDGFGKPCTSGHSMSLKVLLKTLAGEPVSAKKAVSVTVVQGGIVGSEVRRKRAENDLADAQQENENLTRLALKGLISDEEFEKNRAEIAEKLATATAKLATLDGPSEMGEEVPFAGEYQGQMQELVSRLADDSIAFELRRELLEKSGLHRIYVDRPRLRLHFR